MTEDQLVLLGFAAMIAVVTLIAGIGTYVDNIQPQRAKHHRIVEDRGFFTIEYKWLWWWCRLKYDEDYDSWRSYGEAEKHLRRLKGIEKPKYHYHQ